VRIAIAAAAVLSAGVVAAPTPLAVAGPTVCDYPSCTPGIVPNVVLGAPCDNTTSYVFGVTSWGRLVFCGSPRRYDPRWFRSPPMEGVKDENSECIGYETYVAQSPDGAFLTCLATAGHTLWVRGDT
jgi:hypothetical protein